MNKTITKTIALIVPIFAYIGFIFDKNGLNLSIALTVFCYAVLFIADVYTPDQVTNAASAFCGKDHRSAIYEGSSRRCSQPQRMPMVINGKSTSTETYVISGFRCAVENQ